MKNKSKFYLSLIIFSLLGQIAWVVENMYFNVFISMEFGASQFHVALMVSLSAIVATITTLFVGAFSDKVAKRKIFIWLGYILWGFSIIGFSILSTSTLSKIFKSAASISSLGITLTILFDCIMTFFGSSANDASFNSWITDSTTDIDRGKAEGINSMMPLLAVIIVFGLLSGFAQNGSWWILFTIIGVLTILAGFLGLFIILEPNIEKNTEIHYFKRITYGFKKNAVKSNPLLYLCYLCFAVFGIAIQVFMTFLVQYYQAYIPGKMAGMDKYVFVMAPAIIIAAIVTFFYGRLFDKYGFKKTIIPSLGIMSLGLVLLSFTFLTNNIVLIFIGSVLLMSGYLSTTAVFNAYMRNKTPKDMVGSFQGIKMFAQVLIPMLLGPWIGAIALTGKFNQKIDNIIVPSTPEGYMYIVNPSIFIAALIIIIITFMLCILLIKKERSMNNDEK